MIIEAKDLHGDLDVTADAVVVGTGAGGAPAAAVLAETGMNVVVLEKGGYYQAGEFTGDQTTMLRRLWVNGGFLATKDGAITLLQGQCVGGSTVINMCLSWKPPAEAFDRWREETGVEGLTQESLRPHVDEVWRTVNAEPAQRTHINRNNYVFEMGANALGWDVVPMARNVRECQNLGLCLFGCPVNAKQSMLLTYVPRADQAGARIYAGATVRRVLVEGGRAVGVEGELVGRDGRTSLGKLRVRAPIVCLAAGVLETPGILLRSGLRGRGETAGRFFQIHTHTFAYGFMPEPIYMEYGAPQSIAIMQFADVLGRKGPGFIIEGLGVHTVNWSMLVQGFGQPYEAQVEKYRHAAMADAILRDRSRGHVELTDGGQAVAVYDYTPEDRALIKESMRRIAECLLAAGAKEVVIPGSRFGPISKREELDAAAEGIHPAKALQALASAHLFSSARMAGSPEKGFCDSRGEAWDTKGLYVVDASALPGNLGVNPQITIMAVARKIASGIVAERKGG
ncbi:MAG: GMC family oxidoreductase [Nitrospirae bacterium]|nr:GMC family oxidoreductase [Nitrospirota bacterium]